MLGEVIRYMLGYFRIYTHYNGLDWFMVHKTTGFVIAEGTLRDNNAPGTTAAPALQYNHVW